VWSDHTVPFLKSLRSQTERAPANGYYYYPCTHSMRFVEFLSTPDRKLSTSPASANQRDQQCLLLLQLDGSIGYRGLGVPPSQSAMQGERLAHEQAW
jgi:hypothetical protein